MVDLQKILIDITAGTLTSWTQLLVGQPFDFLKTRMQLYYYKNAFECAKDAIQNEGFRSFYKGISAIFFASSITGSLFFSTNELCRR